MTTPRGTAVIRDATEADLIRILELYATLADDHAPPEARVVLSVAQRRAFSDVAADPRQRLLVLEDERRIAGTLVLVIIANLSHEGRPYALVENVVVDPRTRGRRHGETLMRYAIEEARRAGCYKIALTSALRRADAHRFYERLGFCATHRGFRLEL